MLAKLNESFDQKLNASKIYKMVELISIRYNSINKSMLKQISNTSALAEKICALNNQLADKLAVGVLISSIRVNKLRPVVATNKSFFRDQLKCEKFTNKLIDKSSQSYQRVNKAPATDVLTSAVKFVKSLITVRAFSTLSRR